MLKAPRIVVAGTSSGAGKTSVACGIIRALRQAGHAVQPFKAGPDYLDPMHLSAAAGRPAENLDVWMMGKRGVQDCFAQNCSADMSVIEGVMGYYDGASGAADHSSTHHIAEILEAPAVLVVDAGRTARSAAATALGFIKFRRRSRIAGVILNNIASDRHEQMCRQAMACVSAPVIACVRRDPALALESRHLGLVPAPEGGGQAARAASKRAASFIDAGKISRIAGSAPPIRPAPKARLRPRSGATVAVAMDSSFNFYYENNIRMLRANGAKIAFFSPESGSAIPDCDGLYFGGGFPEVRAKQLAKNRRMLGAAKKFAESGRPVYAECGGLMYLSKSISYGKERSKMAGLFDARIEMGSRPVIGYTKYEASKCLVSSGSASLRGHEFHYSKMSGIPKDARFAYRVSAGSGICGKKDGLVEYKALASYGHLYFDGKMAGSMVGSCLACKS